MHLLNLTHEKCYFPFTLITSKKKSGSREKESAYFFELQKKNKSTWIISKEPKKSFSGHVKTSFTNATCFQVELGSKI